MRPVVPGGGSFPPHPQKLGMQWGDNALTAPTTPAKRMVEVDRSKVDPKIVEVGEGMEGMFLDYMMKVMRQTVPKNEMDMSNPATEIYQGMLDSEMAQKAAKTGGVGLADQVIAYLDSQRYTLPEGRNGRGPPQAVSKAPDSAASTGGTHGRIQSR